MSEEVANNEKTTKLGGCTGKGFMPGISGNPSGRPKDTLKQFVAKRLCGMSDEEKEQWLLDNKIAGIDMWKMAEGNPKQDTDVTSGGEKIQPILGGITKDEFYANNSSKEASGNTQEN